jgi:hypothetical protein
VAIPYKRCGKRSAGAFALPIRSDRTLSVAPSPCNYSSSPAQQAKRRNLGFELSVIATAMEMKSPMVSAEQGGTGSL